MIIPWYIEIPIEIYFVGILFYCWIFTFDNSKENQSIVHKFADFLISKQWDTFSVKFGLLVGLVATIAAICWPILLIRYLYRKYKS